MSHDFNSTAAALVYHFFLQIEYNESIIERMLNEVTKIEERKRV
jgi:hypothetical protein